jgi:hypothetical protein
VIIKFENSKLLMPSEIEQSTGRVMHTHTHHIKNMIVSGASDNAQKNIIFAEIKNRTQRQQQQRREERRGEKKKHTTTLYV